MIVTTIAYSTSLNRMVAFEQDMTSGYQWTLRSRQHDYAIGRTAPHFPVPALPPRQTFDSLFDLGFVSAWNGFDIEQVFQLLKPR